MFQDAIMLGILPSIDLHLLKVVLIFLSKILLWSRCVDCFIRGIKELACSSCIVELSEHSRSARSSSLVLSKILASLYDSTMHSARYLIPSVYVTCLQKHPGVQWRIELQGHLRSFFNPYLSPQSMANLTWRVRGTLHEAYLKSCWI